MFQFLISQYLLTFSLLPFFFVKFGEYMIYVASISQKVNQKLVQKDKSCLKEY